MFGYGHRILSFRGPAVSVASRSRGFIVIVLLMKHRPMPKAWRGAALQCRSSIGWQPPKAFGADRRLPGISQRVLLPGGLLFPRDRPARPIELHNHGSFPGAACSQVAELPPYKAAPLQALGRFCACVFANLLCSLLTLQSPARFWVTRRRPSDFAHVLVVERASLARPTSRGWRHRD